MVRRILTAVAAALLIATPVTPATALSCTMTEIIAGICSVGGGTDGTDVNLWVDGSTGGGSSGGGGQIDCDETAEGRCAGVSPPKTVDKPESVHDLESFRPRRPSQLSEPAGWTIAGLPTNFVTRARTHVVSGELAGHSADVRFIPVRFRRTFGDGGTQSTTLRGARWSTAWSATSTSHVYEQPGIETVRLVVTYVADYRYSGLGWVRLGGTVTRTAPDLTIRVFAADTVLVARPCTVDEIGCR